MKNIVDAAAFYKAMTALMEVPSKSSIEVLREIKAEFTGDQCVLSATDLNTWMSVTLPASGDSFGFVFRNSANIQKICRHYDGALELELQQRGDESFLTMRSGSKGGKQTYAANAAKLLACVKQVKYAVGSRNVRPEYQGVLFQNKHIWAVEGHREGCCDDGGLDVEPSFVVGVPELEQLKAFGNADIQISVADNWVLFQNEHVRLLAKRILNVTPMTYESVVPQKWNEEFCFHRKDFVQALKYLLACMEKNEKPYVRFHNGNLSLHANGCLCKAEVPISTESSIVIGFDARFMLDALTQFEKQETVGAILLIAGNSSAIVLPIRLREEQKAA